MVSRFARSWKSWKLFFSFIAGMGESWKSFLILENGISAKRELNGNCDCSFVFTLIVALLE
jgi:hypothetical protein